MPKWGKNLLWLATIAFAAFLYADGSPFEAGGVFAFALISALVDYLGTTSSDTQHNPVEKLE